MTRRTTLLLAVDAARFNGGEMKTDDPKPDSDPTAELGKKLQAAKPYVLAVVDALLTVAIEQGAKIRAEARAKMIEDTFNDEDRWQTGRANEVPDHDENETKTTTQAPPERDISG